MTFNRLDQEIILDKIRKEPSKAPYLWKNRKTFVGDLVDIFKERGHGESNAISTEILINHLKCNRKQVYGAINSAKKYFRRKYGWFLENSRDGRGYYICEKRGDVADPLWFRENELSTKLIKFFDLLMHGVEDLKGTKAQFNALCELDGAISVMTSECRKKIMKRREAMRNEN